MITDCILIPLISHYGTGLVYKNHLKLYKIYEIIFNGIWVKESACYESLTN